MYLDTAVLVKLLVREPDSDFYARTVLTTEVLMRANGILRVCHPTIALRSLDAIHLASAERSQSWPICSNDGRMRLAAEQRGLASTA